MEEQPIVMGGPVVLDLPAGVHHRGTAQKPRQIERNETNGSRDGASENPQAWPGG
jgi:hypothetical protein